MQIKDTSGWCVTYNRSDGSEEVDWVNEWTVYNNNGISIYVCRHKLAAEEFVRAMQEMSVELTSVKLSQCSSS